MRDTLNRVEARANQMWETEGYSNLLHSEKAESALKPSSITLVKRKNEPDIP